LKKDSAGEEEQLFKMKFERNNKARTRGAENNAEVFPDGRRVRHKAFGEGIVISTQDDIVTIAFMKAGIKKLSTKFAELEKI
jgi:hypothetical protein